MYRIEIVVVSKDGSCELVHKNLKVSELEGILSVHLGDIYAEAQQAEIEEGLDIMSEDEYYKDLEDFSY